MAADDPRFDPQVDLQTRLEKLRPLIASANLINGRFGRKVQSATKGFEKLFLFSKNKKVDDFVKVPRKIDSVIIFPCLHTLVYATKRFNRKNLIKFLN